MLYFISFLYGAALGSFVNLIVARLGVAPIINSRSKCLSCDVTLKWYDLVPVFSYVTLGGKCRNCKTPYGKEHLFVEFFLGIIFIFVYRLFLLGQPDLLTSFGWLVYYTLFVVSLSVVTLYDLKHKVIPINFFYGFLALSIIMLCKRFYDIGDPIVFIAPFVVALPFLLLWLISRGRWLGFGDVLMYLAVGAFFGVEQGIAVFFLSVWIGAIVGLLLKLFEGNKYTLKSAIPFVPFISLATIVVLFTDIDIYSIFSIFN